MPDESYDDRILLKLRRKYCKDEAFALVEQELKRLQTEIGEYKSEVAHFKSEVSQYKSKANNIDGLIKQAIVKHDREVMKGVELKMREKSIYSKLRDKMVIVIKQRNDYRSRLRQRNAEIVDLKLKISRLESCKTQ